MRLFIEHPEAGERWSRRFEHVLVDEYQDTNHAQFRLVQALAAVHGNLFVVGDDDQSIYGWRGADLANVLDFERALPGRGHDPARAELPLDRQHPQGRERGDREQPGAQGQDALERPRGRARCCGSRCARDETAEARRVRRHLESRVRAGGRLADCAVLYRTNAQSRALETELRHAGLAYEIVGGVSFYQRREVKDLLAWLRLLVNPADSASFFRVWNTPRRGLGAVGAGAGRVAAGARCNAPPPRCARWPRRARCAGPRAPGRRSCSRCSTSWRRCATSRSGVLFGRLLEKSGYLGHLETACDGDQELLERKANVHELAASAAQFGEEGRGGLLEYLSECSLMTDADRVDENADRVLMLTAHNAKGLEFRSVVVAGLEEGLLPHASSLDDARELEEERRLFYVALTRAKDDVLLTAAAFRRRFDGSWGAQVSRFVDEIPAQLLEREDEGPGRVERPRARAARGGERPRGGRRAQHAARHRHRALGRRADLPARRRRGRRVRLRRRRGRADARGDRGAGARRRRAARGRPARDARALRLRHRARGRRRGPGHEAHGALHRRDQEGAGALRDGSRRCRLTRARCAASPSSPGSSWPDDAVERVAAQLSSVLDFARGAERAGPGGLRADVVRAAGGPAARGRARRADPGPRGRAGGRPRGATTASSWCRRSWRT